MHIITVDEAIAQGTTPGQLLSVAKFNAGRPEGAAVRKVALDLAVRLGVDLGGHRRRRRAERAANDNRTDNAKRRRAA